MANGEGEPRRVSRREALGRAATVVGVGVATASSVGTMGAFIFVRERAKVEAKPILVTDNQYKEALEYLKQSDQTIIKAADEGRYIEVPSLGSAGDPRRKEAQESVTVFQRRQAEIGESIDKTLDPLWKPALVTMIVGFVTWLAGLANTPPRKTPDYMGQPSQPGTQSV